MAGDLFPPLAHLRDRVPARVGAASPR